MEEENSPSITEDPITTHNVRHLSLKTTLEPEDVEELERHIEDAKRIRKADGRRPLNRHHIHDLALQQDREIVVRQTKRRAARIVSTPKLSIQDRLSNR